MALIDVDYLKPLLNLAVTNTGQDQLLQIYLDAASAAVKSYCNRDLESQSYTQYYTGNNTTRLVLKQTPVTTLSGVWLDNRGYYGVPAGTFSAQLTEGVDFVLDRDETGTRSRSGILFRIGTVWPMLARILSLNRLSPDLGPAWGNIKVSYTAGYTGGDIPADLKMATAMVAVSMKRMLPLGGYNTVRERLGDYSYELAMKVLQAPELGSVRTTLAKYRELGW